MDLPRYIACTTPPDPALENGGGRLPKASWTLEHPSIRGVWVGGCVVHGARVDKGSKGYWKAHAHHGKGTYSGWICFASIRWLHVRELWIHELAHIVSDASHDSPVWRNTVLRLGGTLKRVPGVMKSYKPKVKP